MSTSSQPAIPIELTTRRQKYLSQIGLTDKARRLACIEGNWIWYKSTDDLSDAWREQLYTSMMRSDPYLARRLAQDHELRYSAFGGLIRTHFTRLAFRIWADKCTLSSIEHRRQHRLVRKIRKVIRRFLPSSINKLGTLDDRGNRYNRVVKVLYADMVTAEHLLAIQAALPPEVAVSKHVFAKEDFDLQLREWAHADLPLDELDRADFELFLHGLHLVQYYGIPREVSGKFALDSKPSNANCASFPDQDALLASVVASKSGIRRIPRSPKTGQLAKFISYVVDWATKPGEIAPDGWVLLPSTA